MNGYTGWELVIPSQRSMVIDLLEDTNNIETSLHCNKKLLANSVACETGQCALPDYIMYFRSDNARRLTHRMAALDKHVKTFAKAGMDNARAIRVARVWTEKTVRPGGETFKRINASWLKC